MTLRTRRFAGPEIARYIRALALLRIEVFREFPYLYTGSPAYEETYLQSYLTAPQSVMVIAFDGATIVGAATGLPLADADEAFQAPLREAGYDIATVFYFGESVLRRAYRGQGIGGRFFEEREAHARALGRFTTTCFCAVDRPPDHPRRPPTYRPLDAFWQRRGYVQHPELVTMYHWQDLDEDQESPKPMIFWLKQLTTAEHASAQDKGTTGHKG